MIWVPRGERQEDVDEAEEKRRKRGRWGRRGPPPITAEAQILFEKVVNANELRAKDAAAMGAPDGDAGLGAGGGLGGGRRFCGGRGRRSGG